MSTSLNPSDLFFLCKNGGVFPDMVANVDNVLRRFVFLLL
jgi:hypothetical protein